MGSALFRLTVFLFLSIACGYIFDHFNLNFFVGILVGASCQFILTYITNQFVNAYIQLKNKQLENERIREFSYQGIEVECPCHKKYKQLVPFRFNTDNRYKCIDCNKTITVLTETFTALATEPITDTDTTKPDIISNAITKQH